MERSLETDTVTDLQLGSGPGVLYIDESEQVCANIKEALLENGFRAYTVTSVRKALLVMKQKKIDAVVCEVMMPVMSGLELAMVIKKEYPGKLMVLITGYTGYCSPVEAISAGADAFLSKPFEQAALVSLLSKRLGQKPKKILEEDSF